MFQPLQSKALCLSIESASDRASVQVASKQLPGHMRSKGCSRLQVVRPEIDLPEAEIQFSDFHGPLQCLRKKKASPLGFLERGIGRPNQGGQDQGLGLKQTMGMFSKQGSRRRCNSLKFTSIGHKVEVSFQDLLL